VAAQDDCIFCRIADGRLPADVVHVGTSVLALRDVAPQAPTHVLVIPKEHHDTVDALASADPKTLVELVAVAGEVARSHGDGQYRLVFNSGEQAGQSVRHVHGHVLAGRSFAWPPG
jgi:histidine triad (HIT) family protein